MNSTTNTTITSELLGKLAFHFYEASPLLPTYAHLLLAALFPIYAGAHASLSRPASAAPRPKKRKAGKDDTQSDDESEDEGEDEAKVISGLEPADVIIFPIMAGATLLGLYFLLKWMQDPAWLNRLLGGYLSVVGILATTQMMGDGLDLLISMIFPRGWTDGKSFWLVDNADRQSKGYEIASATTSNSLAKASKSPLPGILNKVPLPQFALRALWTVRSLFTEGLSLEVKWHGARLFKEKFGLSDVFGIVFGLGVAYFYHAVARYWWLTNIMGFGFCYGSLQLLSPTSFTTGSMLLAALFVYDVYFVFFTPVMVTVATSLDVPIKLLFPRPAEGFKSNLAMLGLGDIVLPGIMIGLALRYDLYRHYLQKSTASHSTKPASSEPDVKRLKEEASDTRPVYVPMTGKWGERFWSRRVRTEPDAVLDKRYDVDRGAFKKTYFNAAMTGYIIGMITTLLVMQVAQHAQPALLYLVPGVVGALWLTALFRGELKQMWAFSEDEESKREEQEKLKKGEKSEDKTVVSKPEACPPSRPVRSSEILRISLTAPRALLREKVEAEPASSVEAKAS